MLPFLGNWSRFLAVLVGAAMLVPSGALAQDVADFVCGNAAIGLKRYVRSVDPVRMAHSTCVRVSEANTAAQRALIDTVPKKYLTVAGGLAVELTAAEKKVVDAGVAMTAGTAQTLREAMDPEHLCALSSLGAITSALAAREATVQAELDAAREALAPQIAAVTTVAEVQKVLDVLNQAVHDTLSAVNTAHFSVTQTILRCDFARRMLSGRKQ